MIHYVSTRGQAGRRSFEEVLLAGLAEDGGAVRARELARLLGRRSAGACAALDYPALAARLLAPFTAGCFDEADLLRLAPARLCRVRPSRHRALASSRRRRLAARAVPRADPGLQGLRDAAPGRDVRRGAGAARASGSPSSAPPRAIPVPRPCRPLPASGRSASPCCTREGRVSPVQRRQMTTVPGRQRAQHRRPRHVRRLPGPGEGDVRRRCRSASELRLSAVNSINWARVVAQAVYYVWAALRLGAPDRPVAFAVPTGNFGNVYAGGSPRRSACRSRG